MRKGILNGYLDGRLVFINNVLEKTGFNEEDRLRDKLKKCGLSLILANRKGGASKIFILYNRDTNEDVCTFFTAQELWDFLPLYVPNVWGEL